MRARALTALMLLVLGTFGLVACGDDDGAGVRNLGGDECTESGSASSPASASASTSGSSSACASASSSAPAEEPEDETSESSAE